MPTEPDWNLANCKGKDTEIFYPVSGNQDGPAKAICWECPIRQACADWAMETFEPHGVWGGMSEKDRRHAMRQKNPRWFREPVEAVGQQRYQRTLKLRAAGLVAREIAEEMRIDLRTVQRYLAAGESCRG